jgi:hypothetical protein
VSGNVSANHRAQRGMALRCLVRMQIDLRKFLGDEIEEAGFAKRINLRVELEALEDVAHSGRERLDVGEEILSDVILIAHTV